MRYRLGIAIVTILAALAATAPAQAADLFSKAFKFKANTRLDVGIDLPEGLRLDSIEFGVPDAGGASPSSFMGQPKAEVAISNLGGKSIRVGIVISLTDDEGRLLGVASGGTKMFPLRTDRQMTYSLVFDDVNTEVSKATVFRVSIEAKP